MNRYGHILVSCLLTLGCQGQPRASGDSLNDSFNDSNSIVFDSVVEPEVEFGKEGALTTEKVRSQETTLRSTDPVPKEESEDTLGPVVVQTQTATIWTEEQRVFLEEVDKILLFHVRITDIGSRKLELDSQLATPEHEALIKALLSGDSYPSSELTERADQKEFVPKYQVLLEGANDKLTLMFDTTGLEMVVANLFNRENYAITSVMVDCIENIKKNQ